MPPSVAPETKPVPVDSQMCRVPAPKSAGSSSMKSDLPSPFTSAASNCRSALIPMPASLEASVKVVPSESQVARQKFTGKMPQEYSSRTSVLPSPLTSIGRKREFASLRPWAAPVEPAVKPVPVDTHSCRAMPRPEGENSSRSDFPSPVKSPGR